MAAKKATANKEKETVAVAPKQKAPATVRQKWFIKASQDRRKKDESME